MHPLDFVKLTTRTPHGVHRTCGEPNESELTTAHGLSNGFFAGTAMEKHYRTLAIDA